MFDFTAKVLSFEDWKFTPCDYRVAIPSYKRAEILKNKTLKVLSESNVPSEKIDVFVADEKEKELYEKTLIAGTYSRIIIGVPGMRRIRNFIQDFYDEGDMIVNLDDDIEKIERFVDEKTIVDFNSLNEFFCYAFDVCKKIGVSYWGVYAVDNPYFMDNSVACGLRYLLGGFWGTITNHDKSTYVTLDDKEDFERSVRAYLYDGSVARFDFMSYKTKCYTEQGGMQVERTEERVEWSGKKMLEMFPNQCEVNSSRKQHFEVKLVEKRESFKKISKHRIQFNKQDFSLF